MTPIAHTRNVAGKRQDLLDHLCAVAEVAAAFAAAFDGERFARYAGLLHDIGKFDPAFQQYLLDAEQNPTRRMRGPDHKGAGAVLAQTAAPAGFLAFLIHGHHGGLASRSDLKTTIRERMTNKAVQEAIATAKRSIPELQAIPQDIIPAQFCTELERELFVRMAFSALVDADFLDTEQHFNAGKRPERENHWPIAILWERFAASYQQFFASAPRSDLNAIRAEVYQACLNAAALSPGFFRLTVPTGGGKTLASLAFALQHALICERERIIYAIPYTSIIDQTAKVFRDVLGDELALIEHHSDIVLQDPEKPTPAEIRRRLAAENWDASLVVTTTVQLFESLLGCETGKCRKLHNIARSVLILDEVQMLPVRLLTPILDVLRQLVAHYGVTVVLCTATQPDFGSREGFKGLEDIQEILPLPMQKRHFATLQRVEYQLPAAGETWTWEQVATRVQAEPQILVIVNTRRDATELLNTLTADGSLDEEEQQALFHLSTRLCGIHRHAVLEEIKHRLKEKEPCRLIATQVIEAGVDVDFPLVMRAIGPLDRIVQAAGRANREGKMAHPATVIVFHPADGHFPKGSYLVGSDITKRLLADASADLHDPALYQQYFREYYGYPYLDYYGIQDTRERFDYPLVAAKFHMIEEKSTAVVVRYQPVAAAIDKLLDRLRDAARLHREDLRALQPYTVSLLTYEFENAQQQGLVREVLPGVWEWLGNYDSGIDGKHGQGLTLSSVLSVESTIW